MSLSICKRCGTETQDWPGKCPACGSTEAVSVAPAKDTFVGRTVNARFKLTKKIGQGGMGTVYEAEDLKLGMRAALKFLNPELSRNVELARRFMSEARTYARISHPGAVTLHDFGQDEDGTLYIAMEFVEGQNLKDLLDARKRLPTEEAVDIILQIANVLAFMHEKGVVHRDLKPENVMVRKGLHGFHVKLLDFGVARRNYDGATRLTAHGAMAGTPRYMAPEQVRGEDVDGRVDVYALGLLTFELLTGVPAVDAIEVDQVMKLQLDGRIRKLGDVDPLLAHPQLDLVIAKATHKDKLRRTQTMEDFAAALSAAAKGTAPGVPAFTPEGTIAKTPAPGPVVPAQPNERTYFAGGAGRSEELRSSDVAKATPIPLATPYRGDEKPKGRGLALWGLLAVVLAAAGAGAGFWQRQRSTVVVVQTPAPVSACPGQDIYVPELRELSTSELERRVAALPIMRPSDARAQLQRLKVTVESYAESQRECMYRAMLMGSITSAQTVLRTTPAMWGQTRELGRLRSLFLELPLKHAWTPEQRGSVLHKIESLFIANLDARDEADKDYWRRQYLGIELLCEVTDEALAELHTERPHDCLNLVP